MLGPRTSKTLHLEGPVGLVVEDHEVVGGHRGVARQRPSPEVVVRDPVRGGDDQGLLRETPGAGAHGDGTGGSLQQPREDLGGDGPRRPGASVQLDEAAITLGTHPEAVIELDTGMNRGGQLPGDQVLRLADLIASMDGLKLAGLMTWEGHCMKVADPIERDAAIRASVGKLVDMAEQVRAQGIPVEIVSAGGTGTYLTTASIEGVTEVQAGGGIWDDQMYLNLGANVEPALTIMAQVVSRPQPDRILTDAGRKTVDPTNLAPIPQNVPAFIEQGFSAEHGKIVLAGF